MNVRALINKLKGNHAASMLFGCIAVFGIAATLFFFTGAGSSSLFLLILLLCPIMHFLMMRKH